MTRYHDVFDASTGETTQVPYSPDEEAAADAASIPTLDMLYAERDRRLAAGFVYDFGDERGVHTFGTTPADWIGWDRVTKLKDAMIQMGDTTSIIGISTKTGRTGVTAPEWNGILLYAATQFEQPIWQASFDLEDMDPIPANYADDSYWP